MNTVTDLLAPFSDSELEQLRKILAESYPASCLLRFIEQELAIRAYFLEGDSF